jgi:hypothetical protein
LVQDSRHFFGANNVKQDIKKALELASACEHPTAIWLTKLFAGRNMASREEARVFLSCENDPRALCFAGVLGGRADEVRRAAELGDAFAQASMAERTGLARDEVFDGQKNPQLKENALVSTALVVATKVEKDARKTWK